MNSEEKATAYNPTELNLEATVMQEVAGGESWFSVAFL